MKTTFTAALNLDFASVAPPPDLPAVFPPETEVPPPRAIVEKALTPDGLAKMLADRQQRHDGWTPIRVAAFIETLANTGSVTKAAALAHMSVAAAYHLRNHPDAEGFREAWNSALAVRFETLSELAMDRIVNGVEKARWNGEMVIGHDRVFSDRLLIHMLNRLDPDRDRSVPVQGEAQVCRVAGPRRGVLPMTGDFVVAGAVETGKLGWDPAHDDAELDPEIAADVAAIHARKAEQDAAVRAEIAADKEEARIKAAEFDAQTERMRHEDEGFDERMEILTSPLKSSTSLDSDRVHRYRRR